MVAGGEVVMAAVKGEVAMAAVTVVAMEAVSGMEIGPMATLTSAVAVTVQIGMAVTGMAVTGTVVKGMGVTDMAGTGMSARDTRCVQPGSPWSGGTCLVVVLLSCLM